MSVIDRLLALDRRVEGKAGYWQVRTWRRAWTVTTLGSGLLVLICFPLSFFVPRDAMIFLLFLGGMVAVVFGSMLAFRAHDVGIDAARFAVLADGVVTVPTLRGETSVVLGGLTRVRCQRLGSFDLLRRITYVWVLADDRGGRITLVSQGYTAYPFLPAIAEAIRHRPELALSARTRRELDRPGSGVVGSTKIGQD